MRQPSPCNTNASDPPNSSTVTIIVQILSVFSVQNYGRMTGGSRPDRVRWTSGPWTPSVTGDSLPNWPSWRRYDGAPNRVTSVTTSRPCTSPTPTSTNKVRVFIVTKIPGICILGMWYPRRILCGCELGCCCTLDGGHCLPPPERHCLLQS